MRQAPCLFSGLVVIASAKLPIPSRTRPISAPTPMVLRLKTWESRSPPDLKRDSSLKTIAKPRSPIALGAPAPHMVQSVAGWSSPVARQAHNLKAAGSNPAPATKNLQHGSKTCAPPASGALDVQTAGQQQVNAPPRAGVNAVGERLKPRLRVVGDGGSLEA